MKKRFFILAILYLTTWVAPVWSQVPESDSAAEGQMSLDELRVFVRVFEQLKQAYVEDISDAELFELAIWGMLSELDPHSEFLDLEEISALEDASEGRFSGIGVELTMEGDFLTIVTPIDNSPAAQAGIEPGDIILKVNGESIEGLSFRQSLRRLEGESGESLSLTLNRISENNLVEVELVRERIAVESVESRVVAEDVGYLRISQFQQNTSTEFTEDLTTLLDGNPLLTGLILDLRNNPGGLLRSAVDIADIFLESGTIVSTQGRIESANRTFYAKSGSSANDLPLVVLINRGSASAAEIVAGALQDHERAVILGDISFGKGSVQEVLHIDDTRAIKLTIARYFTPSGRSIQAQGIYPDIRVDQGSVNWDRDEGVFSEASLAGHLDNDGEGPELIGLRETLSDIEDVQLAHAISLLQGSALLQKLR
jgi:carboxyl-terminal processing protease